AWLWITTMSAFTGLTPSYPSSAASVSMEQIPWLSSVTRKVSLIRSALIYLKIISTGSRTLTTSFLKCTSLDMALSPILHGELTTSLMLSCITSISNLKV
ncbi:unnamed protein product, partial [Ranitomeya imitator]